MTPHRVFIVGQEGTTGLRIHERLSDRKDIELLATADEDRKNVEAIKVVAKKADLDVYGPFINWRQPIWKEWLFIQPELHFYNSKKQQSGHAKLPRNYP